MVPEVAFTVKAHASTGEQGFVEFLRPGDGGHGKQLPKGDKSDLEPSSSHANGTATNDGTAGSLETEPLIGQVDASMVAPPTSGGGPSRSTKQDESTWRIFLQAAFPLFLAGFGQVGAGLVLDRIQHWHVFDEIPELFTLVTALLGLKGNLEMTLASRMSTLANTGKLDTRHDRLVHTISNICLVEAQATLLSFLAALVAVSLRWVTSGLVVWPNASVLITSSLSTGCSAAFILAVIMVGVIVASHALNINPDNVATPLAASFGDLITLVILAYASAFFLHTQTSMPWLCPVLGSLLLLLMPLWTAVISLHPSTKNTLTEGVNAIVLAMLISSGSGYILGYSVRKFQGIAVFQPVINGFGGNLVAVQASRMSTYLHKHSEPGALPDYTSGRVVRNPCHVFFGDHPHRSSACLLLMLTFPGHLICLFLVSVIGAGHTTSTVQFVLVYLAAAFIQVALLLIICHAMVHLMWKCRVDPDNAAIPYLTAIGDLFGTLLLLIGFAILYAVGDRDKDVGD